MRSHGRRGRPSKFGRPSEVVALTLPEEVVRGLRKIDADLAWAIVTLFERGPRRPAPTPVRRPVAELALVGGGRALIVVSRSVIRSLPGITIIPLDAERAFLALAPGQGMSDLELAVIDRLENAAGSARERGALAAFRAQLRRWRHDPSLHISPRSIIVVERSSRRISIKKIASS
jgi:hypothetical protein